MNPGRIINEYRPQVLFIVLLAGSLFSLVMGTEGSFIHRGLSRMVSLTAYPLLKLQETTSHAFSRSYKFIKEYQDVFEQNQALVEEMATLKRQVSRLHELQQENRRIRKMVNYARSEGRMTLFPVTILESYKGLLRIDGGSAKGIEVSMGVVTPEGVVGVVTEVADFTATVATLHHMDCRVGAMVSRNRLRAYDGIIHASGNDFNRLCTMEYIDMKENVRAGEWVVTSPESQFGAGLPIGRIKSVQTGAGLWKSAEIEPVVDPYRLDEVFVIMQIIDDADTIAGVGSGTPAGPEPDEPLPVSPSNAPDMPDMRPPQERFAP